MTASPVMLVPEQTSHEMERVLIGLLELARDGELSGIIFGVSLKGQRYYCDAAGALHRNPVVALGVADMLSEELRKKLRHNSLDTMF